MEATAQSLEDLRLALLQAQHALRAAGMPVLILLEGDDAQGVRRVSQQLHDWMDTRFIRTKAFRSPSGEEATHTHFWRYWRMLPGRSEMAIFVRGWSYSALRDFKQGKLDHDGLQARAARIKAMCAHCEDHDTIIVRLWLRSRPKASPSPGRRTPADIITVEDNESALHLLLTHTETHRSKWHVLEGLRGEERDREVARLLLHEFKRALNNARAPKRMVRPTAHPDAPSLSEVRLERALDPASYERKLMKWQGKLTRYAELCHAQGIRTIIALEGWDAAGKGGIIRRFMRALDPEHCRVTPVSEASHGQQDHPFLWPYWQNLPGEGQFAIFDRSWYTSVLSDRVYGRNDLQACQRAYVDIIDFETQQAAQNTVVLKFWLHLDADEQLARFNVRNDSPSKAWKLSRRDWHNRERRAEFEEAVEDMLRYTHTDACPWRVIAAQDKRHARVKVIKTICRAMREELEKHGIYEE